MQVKEQNKLSQNNFVVAIQGIMLQAQSEGWDARQIVDLANDAVAEFEEGYTSWDDL